MTRFNGDLGVMPDYSNESNGEHTKKTLTNGAHALGAKVAALPSKVPTPRGAADVIQVLSSVFLRLLVFVFLRWIPARGSVPTIPALFAAYVFSWAWHDIRFRVRLRKVARAARAAAGVVDNGKSAQSPPLRDIVEVQTAAWPSLAGAITSLAFGSSTRSRRWNHWLLLAHALVFALFLDSFYSPFLFPSHYEYNLRFARVGGLGATDAKIHVRYPHPLPIMDGLQEDIVDEAGMAALRDSSILNPEPLRVVWREASDEPEYAKANAGGLGYALKAEVKRWERGPLLRLTEASDWTAVAHIQNLWPATRYEWRLMFAHNATFAPYPDSSRFFTTFPDPRLAASSLVGPARRGIEERNPLDNPNHFTFATSSCIKPDFPYHPAQFIGWNWLLRLAGLGTEPGGITQRNRIPGFDLMADRLVDARTGGTAIRFFLQLGDFIYSDVPRVRRPTRANFRQLYRNVFASESARRVYEHVPIVGIWDDHEGPRNNFGGVEEAVRDRDGLESASTAWYEYVGMANPDPLERGENYFSFRYGDTAFFVLDTRKHRTPASEPDDEAKTMLGQVQKDALFRWLGAVNQTATFKFVVSSVPFNTLWGGPLDWDGKHDTWTAYFTERQEVLERLQYVPNVIVLSGDRHEFASVGLRQTVTEFSTSPLSMFYLPVRTLAEEHAKGPAGEEKLYKYIPDGNYKWTEFEVDTRDAANPVVHATVLVDGAEAWKVTVLGVPTRPIPAQLGDRLCSGYGSGAGAGAKGGVGRLTCLLARYLGLVRAPVGGPVGAPGVGEKGAKGGVWKGWRGGKEGLTSPPSPPVSPPAPAAAPAPAPEAEAAAEAEAVPPSVPSTADPAADLDAETGPEEEEDEVEAAIQLDDAEAAYEYTGAGTPPPGVVVGGGRAGYVDVDEL